MRLTIICNVTDNESNCERCNLQFSRRASHFRYTREYAGNPRVNFISTIMRDERESRSFKRAAGSDKRPFLSRVLRCHSIKPPSTFRESSKGILAGAEKSAPRYCGSLLSSFAGTSGVHEKFQAGNYSSRQISQWIFSATDATGERLASPSRAAKRHEPIRTRVCKNQPRERAKSGEKLWLSDLREDRQFFIDFPRLYFIGVVNRFRQAFRKSGRCQLCRQYKNTLPVHSPSSRITASLNFLQ